MSRVTRRTILGATIATASALPAFAAAPSFAIKPGIKAVLMARQSAVCQVADFGTTQVLMLVVNGAPIDVHARRNGIYHPKDPANSRSVRALAPVDLNRLITAAGGLDQPVNGSLRADDFHALFNGLKPVTLTRACVGGTCRAMGKGQRLPVSDTFFRDWSFAHDPSGPFLAFSSPTVKAVWSLES